MLNAKMIIQDFTYKSEVVSFYVKAEKIVDELFLLVPRAPPGLAGKGK